MQGDKYVQPGSTRLRNVELVYPVCTGTVSFWLGKKATEYHSHRWTVYVRGPNNEDITHIVQKVTFHLHTSFANPVRTVEAPPFELTETGWGEFEIGVTLHFPPDCGEKDMELFHRLRLYNEDDPTGAAQNPKKPVAVEQMEELVFSEPHEGWYMRASNTPPTPAAPLSIQQYLPPIVEAEDLAPLQEARQKVAMLVGSLKQQQALEEELGGYSEAATPMAM